MVAPGGRKALENGNEVGSQEVLLQIGMSREDIESDRELLIGGIDEYDVVNSTGGNNAKNAVDQITMGIKQGDTFSVFDVLADEVEKERGLSRP